MIRVGIFGTFDIANFGDVLFPIVAEKKLAKLAEIEVIKFSYHRKSAADWYYEVETISDLPNLIGRLDLALIGGGHLIHFNRQMAKNYFPVTDNLPHPLGFWWLPALAASVAGIPVATNGVSADPQLPAWGKPLLESFVGLTDYVSVRDAASAATLAKYGPDKSVRVIPDTVFSISDLIDRGDFSREFDRFRQKHSLNAPYLIVQPSDALWKDKSQIMDYIESAQKKGWKVLELPIGHGVGNYTGFYGAAGLIRPDDWPSPILLAEIIANSEAVIGVSLHLSIVASSFGIPVYRPEYSKSSKFVVLDDLPNVRYFSQKAPLVGQSEQSSKLTIVSEYKRRLDEHWAALVILAKSPNSSASVKLGAIWEQLCGTPDAFRCLRGWNDIRSEMRLHLGRRRHFLMHGARKFVRQVAMARKT